jgi:membrane protease YdiL (CAAX protease family)
MGPGTCVRVSSTQEISCGTLILMKWNPFSTSVLVYFYAFLFLVRIIDNDIIGAWENTHISQGTVGSWIWVIIKFTYWCVPIAISLLLMNKFMYYIKKKFAFDVSLSYSLLFILLWLIVLLAEDHFHVPARDTTYFHLVNSVITTPFIEEFVFRGFILDTLIEKTSFQKANLLQAILFACIHLPYYYGLGKFNNIGLLIGSLVYLSLFAYVSGYLAKTTTSLYPSVLFHAINNLLS